jgi:hypothetical protein
MQKEVRQMKLEATSSMDCSPRKPKQTTTEQNRTEQNQSIPFHYNQYLPVRAISEVAFMRISIKIWEGTLASALERASSVGSRARIELHFLVMDWVYIAVGDMSAALVLLNVLVVVMVENLNSSSTRHRY